ncbi:dual specificity protein phosphatase family protein [Gilliamella sp. A7]|uniref:dual specificity protein phosphatase family protein n=1 Tax=Gilliamella sp. A7 TaxID=1970465 RepID=UPI000A35B532|nr:dual specificity protein phosphatase family protein [Gilliamella sp. A7]OTQ59099.1 hypothetical protein B6D18_05040 [Gilliamella sp. A7]
MMNRAQQVMAHFSLQIAKIVNIMLLCCLSFIISSCQSNVNSNLFPNNFHQVSNDIYRSEQPSLKQIKQLDKLGIKTIINLRLWHSDRDKVANTEISEVWINMRAGDISDEKIIQILKAIKTSPKPILIHCWHGSDRTGAVIAMYRLIFQNWSKHQAIDELMQPEFGHHYNIYPNIKNYINNVDIDQIRQAVFE